MDPMASAGKLVADRYRLVEPIGPGATTWMAVDETLQRPVAVKCPGGVVDAERAATVRHPFVAAILDHGQTEDGTTFVVTEYLDGTSLAARLRQESPPLAVNELIRIVHQALAGLAAIHRAGIAHGDLKAENILLCRGWPASGPRVAQLVDFGMADAGGANGDDADEAATAAQRDLRAVGFILSLALTGKSRRRDHAPLRASALSALRPDLPSELMELVARATGADPGAGFSSADQLAAELREAARRIPADSTTAAANDTPAIVMVPLQLVRRKILPAVAVVPRRWSLPRVRGRMALGMMIVLGTLATAGWARLARAPGPAVARAPAANRPVGIVITPLQPRRDPQP
jgi:serine/threonine protein kinase